MIKVSIVANIPIIREGLRALLANEKDLKATTINSADSNALFERVLSERPDVLLIDVEVLEREGWALVRDLQGTIPNLPILLISDTPDDRRIANALALGAQGYLLREASAEQMAASIRAAARGLVILHPAAARLLSAANRVDTPEASGSLDDDSDGETRDDDLIEPLSARELDVLRLMARGLANKQIANELFISEHTVKFHIRSILGKLGAANRTEAVTLALHKGLVAL